MQVSTQDTTALLRSNAWSLTKKVVRQEPSEESSLSAGLLDIATAPATDPEEEMLAKQYVKKKKKPQRKRGFRL